MSTTMTDCGRPRKAPPRFPEVEEAIKAKGTVKQFAIKAGLHEQTYYAMQAGNAQPTLNTIIRVLEYTGLDFDTAFAGNKKCRPACARR